MRSGCSCSSAVEPVGALEQGAGRCRRPGSARRRRAWPAGPRRWPRRCGGRPVGGGAQLDRRAELVLEPVRRRPRTASGRRRRAPAPGRPRSGSRSTCTTPSSSSCAMPWRNCLYRPVSRGPGDGEVLGREASGSAGTSTGLVDVERVADAHVGGVDQADDVAGERLVDGLALLAEHRVGVLGGERLAGAAVGDDHAALEAPGADPDEGDAVAVGRVHVGLHLEHERRRTARRAARGSPVDVGRGRRATGARSTTRVEQQAHAEVGERRAEEHRAWTRRRGTAPGRRRRRRASSSVELLDGAGPRRRPPRPRPRRRSTTSSGAIGGAAGGAGEADEVAGRAGRARRGSRRRCRPAR